MAWIDWYDALAKPTWTPAPSTIGLIWNILYPIILVSFGFVFVQSFRKKLSWKVAMPFTVNLAANILFMPILAGMRNFPLASLDILIVWATILWLMIAVWRHYRWVSLAQIPYFSLKHGSCCRDVYQVEFGSTEMCKTYCRVVRRIKADMSFNTELDVTRVLSSPEQRAKRKRA